MKLDPAWWQGSSWLMHPTTLGPMQKLLDKYGRPIWAPGLAAGEPDRLMGYKYFLNSYMDQVQANASSPAVNKKTLIFGRLDKHFVRQVLGLTLFRDEATSIASGLINFTGFARYDGHLIEAGVSPCVYLVNTY